MIRKIREIFQKRKILKNKSAQAMIEFVMILPLLIMILLGTYDIFNLSFSYLQMTFLGNSFLGANLMNQKIGGVSPTSGTRNPVYDVPNHPGTAIQNIIRDKAKDATGFPMYFFFGQGPQHRNDPKYEFCISKQSTDLEMARQNAVGAIHCITVMHNVDLITGKMMFNKPRIVLKKKVCGIQEKTFSTTNGADNPSNFPECPRDMYNVR